MVGRCPEEIRVGEEEFGLTILLPAIIRKVRIAVLLAVGAEYSFFGKEQVEDDLGIESPVAGVIEDEYGVDLEGCAEVAGWVDGVREWAG